MAATLELRDDQKCPLTIKITDAKGQPAPTDDAPLWQSSNPAVAEVMPSDDGLSCEIIAGVPGDATVSVSADADLGDGTTTIAGSIDVHVTPGSAMAVEITPGTPEAQ